MRGDVGHTAVAARALGALVTALLDRVGDALAEQSGLTSTQARGTIRLVLKEQGVDARIARKADYLAILGAPLEEALAKRRITLPTGLDAALKRVIESSDEHEDAYDLFRDIE